MSVKLDWSLFRRLIQLELLLLLIAVPAAIGEYLSFSELFESFDAQASEAGYRDASDVVLIPVISLLAIAYVASLFGLLKKTRWSRQSYLLTFVLALPAGWFFTAPVWLVSHYTDTLMVLTSLISGAILLLSFSRDHGAVWFDVPRDDI